MLHIYIYVNKDIEDGLRGHTLATQEFKCLDGMGRVMN